MDRVEEMNARLLAGGADVPILHGSTPSTINATINA
jgi:hypothetical protein